MRGRRTMVKALSTDLAAYVLGLTIGQGRYAGGPFRLLGWQRRFLVGAFRASGDAALSMARGGGKSTFIAAVGCAAVDVGGPLVAPMGETVVVASSFDQGYSAVFRHVLWFLRPSITKHGRGVRGRFRVQDSASRASVEDRETGAVLRVLGSDPRRMHGLQPRLLILDEVAQWPPATRDRALAALRTSRGKIPDSKALWLGTRPADPSHPFERALNGHGTGFSVTYAAPPDAPPFRKVTWLRANPSLRYGFPDLEEAIRSEAAEARRDPDALASFRALRLNQGTSDVARAVLLDPAAWTRAEGLALADRRGAPVWGIDLGTTAAMSALAAYWPTGQLEAVAVFPEVPDLRRRGLADGGGRPVSLDGRAGRVGGLGPSRVGRAGVAGGGVGSVGPSVGGGRGSVAGRGVDRRAGSGADIGAAGDPRPGLQGWRPGREGLPAGDPWRSCPAVGVAASAVGNVRGACDK